MTTTAEYRGRKYRLAWRGQTKYGERAKLQFFDGSREFWVDAGAITISTDSPKSYSFGRRSGAYSHECWACREARAEGKEACWQCTFDVYDN